MQEQEGGERERERVGLRERRVSELIRDKKRLVEVPYTASLADTINALMANRIVAAPVAAPPGHWIGAGGSMIMEWDKQTGAARKHYIGMVTMLDVLAHIAGNGAEDLDRRMQVPVSSIIGHCLESLTLWTINTHTSIADCMEVLSKGIHRALVPVDSQMENIGGVELMESASSYRMLTQMDLLRYLKDEQHHLQPLFQRPVSQLGAVVDTVFGVFTKTKVMDAISSINRASLNAVPILESNAALDEDHRHLVNGKGRKAVGTFSATDLRGCPISVLQSCLQVSVMEFIKRLSEIPLHESSGLRNSTDELVTCRAESSLGEVVEKVVNNHVHRAWVVDESGMLTGVISLTDIIKVIRVWMLSDST
ncbi:SNF1-related protein kinase regulatory subunit gamma-like PV42a [Salvia miltiorrhiza]|uniref:SNF1-related protein kinase regulatory subunit gamma-like PV42a n=1 Tax=Salvia miltiorrhiza TaxID=226208 RepID=UPI0025ACCB57|nr:SNF1-related protein kinase regulatory subunit gamma-like PV42a [Salvia miltiorrhiza]